MLTDPVFADYMQAYGRGGLRAGAFGQLGKLARLYWYTVEFGLLQTESGLRIYGAGIVSSRTESVFALDDGSPNRLGFDLTRVLRTPYRIDDFQQVYFVIESLKSLLDTTVQTDFAPIYTALSGAPDIPLDAILPDDKLFTRGNAAPRRDMMRIIGLMSGTSLDGVDAAVLDTDGETITATGPRTHPALPRKPCAPICAICSTAPAIWNPMTRHCWMPPSASPCTMPKPCTRSTHRPT